MKLFMATLMKEEWRLVHSKHFDLEVTQVEMAEKVIQRE